MLCWIIAPTMLMIIINICLNLQFTLESTPGFQIELIFKFRMLLHKCSECVFDYNQSNSLKFVPKEND